MGAANGDRRQSLEATSSTAQLVGSGGGGGGGNKLELKKTMSLVGAVAMISGTMIGSGIFISPKGVLSKAGSVGNSLIVWTACGVLSLFGALSYAELGTLINKSGGEYAYLNEGLTPTHRFLGAIPAFLFSWVGVVITKPSGVAIITLACATYILDLIYDDCGPPEITKKLLTAFLIVLLGALNIYSAKLSAKVQNVCFFVKLAACFGIVIGGIYNMAKGRLENLGSKAFDGSSTDVSKLALSFYNGLWAYDGWNNLNYVTEEVVNPRRNIPLAIIISLPLVTVVYLMVNISYFTALTPEQLLASNAVAISWAEDLLPSLSVVVLICVAFSTFGAANGTLVGGSRVLYASAREGHMVSLVSMLDVRRMTPTLSIVWNIIIAIVMVIPADIGSLIDFFSFTSWIFYGLVMVSLIVMRWTRPNDERPFKCPIFIPIIVLLAALYLVVAPIIETPDVTFLYAFLFTIAGLIFYIPFVALKVKLSFFDQVTLFFQRLLQLAPPTEEPKE